MFISFKVSGGDVSKDTEVKFEEEKVTLKYKDDAIELELANGINSEESVKTATAKKIELKLMKKVKGANWM